MKQLWNSLPARQKMMVTAAAIFVIGALLFQFAVTPAMEAHSRMRRAITSQEKILKEMSVLGPEYGRLKQRSEDVRRVAAQRSANFSLFSYLEGKAGETGLRSNIRYMNPAKSVAIGGLEESSVEMKLEKITLKQLTQFLHVAESQQDCIWIPKISIEKMKESPEYLNAQLQVVTYLQARVEGR
jgi:hypothetical protein